MAKTSFSRTLLFAASGSSLPHQKMVIWYLVLLSSIITIFAVPSSAMTASVNDNEDKKEFVQDTIKSLLHLNEFEDDHSSFTRRSKSTNAASKYMKDIYNDFHSGKASIIEGAEIRSISPKIGGSVTDGKDDLLIFDLSPIYAEGERIIQADLYYNLRHHKKHNHHRNGRNHHHHTNYHRFNIRATARSLSKPEDENDQEDPASSALPIAYGDDLNDSGTEGWLVFSALKQIQNMDYPDQFGIEFSRVLRNGHLKRRESQHVLRRHTPFLLVHSVKDDQRSVGAGELIRSKRSIRQHQQQKEKNTSTGMMTYHTKTAQDPLKPIEMHVKAFQTQGPEILQTRREIRQHRKQMAKERRQRRLKNRNRNRQRHRGGGNYLSYSPSDYNREEREGMIFGKAKTNGDPLLDFSSDENETTQEVVEDNIGVVGNRKTRKGGGGKRIMGKNATPKG